MSDEMRLNSEDSGLYMGSEAVSDSDLEDISGGAGASKKTFRKVAGLKSGYLAIRSEPCYDYNNEKRGHELYNGDLVQVLGPSKTGSDGRPYTYIKSLKDDCKGYVNSNFLKRV